MLYQVKIEALGDIIKLPDSQTLFGALIWSLSNKKQNSMISELFKEKSQYMLEVSNVFPSGYIPNGYTWGNEMFNCQIGKHTFLIKNSDYKNDYKSKKWLNQVGKFEQIIEEPTYRDRNEFKETYTRQEGGIFSQNITRYNTTEFWFFIRTNMEIDKLVKKDEVLRLGARSGQGLNLYNVLEIESLEEPACKEEQNYINLGMLGYNNLASINMYHSAIKTYRSERKSVTNTSVEIVEYIAEGSIIQLHEKVNLDTIKRYEKIADKRYLYTGGFLLPIQKQEVV